MSRIVSAVLVAVVVISLPQVVGAAVTINEVAWMGTSVDNGSYCEWVELANTGTEDVSLSGWTLTTADGGMSVPLSGVITASGFFLIERLTPTACPDPVPGITADVSSTFGSGLSNTGEILVLTSGTAEVERIDASDGWEAVIQGDATQKLTSQRTSSGWTSGTATPRAANNTGGTPTVEEEDDTETAPVVTVGGSSTTSGVGSTGLPKIYIAAGPNRIVTAHADTPYRAVVYDASGRLRHNTQVSWTFGDGGKETGAAVSHAYELPGQYVAVVRASADGVSVVRTVRVDVVEHEVGIEVLPHTGVVLTNNSDQTLDLSGWVIQAERRTFRIPEDTIVLQQSQTRFPNSVTKLPPTITQVTLRYPGGQLAATSPVQPQEDEEGSNQGMLPEQAPVLFEETVTVATSALIGMMP